jgi:hypothetical protein
MVGTPWLVTVGNGAWEELPEDEPLLEPPLLLLPPELLLLLLLDPLSPPEDEEPHAAT